METGNYFHYLYQTSATAIVFGVGGIDLNVIQGLKLVGAGMTVGVGINNHKKAWAERFGMTHFVNPREVGDDIVPYLVDMTTLGADQIGGADYPFDCTGKAPSAGSAASWSRSALVFPSRQHQAHRLPPRG